MTLQGVMVCGMIFSIYKKKQLGRLAMYGGKQKKNKFEKRTEKNKEDAAKRKAQLVNKIKTVNHKRELELAEKKEPLKKDDVTVKLIHGLKDTIKKNNETFQKERSELKAAIDALTSENGKLKANLLTKEIESEEEIKVLKKQLSSMKSTTAKTLDAEVSAVISAKTEQYATKNHNILSEISNKQIKALDRLNSKNDAAISLMKKEIATFNQQLKTLQVEHVASKRKATVEAFDILKEQKDEIKHLNEVVARLRSELNEEKKQHDALKKELNNGGQWLNVEKVGAKNLINVLMAYVTPKNVRKLDTLNLLVARYNRLVEGSKLLDIWHVCEGEIHIEDKTPYLMIDGKQYPITDLNGFIHIAQGMKFEALRQKFSGAIRLTFETPLDKPYVSSVVHVKEVKETAVITEADLENKNKLKAALKGRRILIVSWHNMSRYIAEFKKYGAKVKVLDSKKHNSQIIEALFSTRYDASYLFFDGVEHGIYYAVMKKLKGYQTPPEHIRLMFESSPSQTLEDAFMLFEGTKKKSPFSSLKRHAKTRDYDDR